MTIYVDDFHTIRASTQDDSRRYCCAISDQGREELSKFVRLISTGRIMWHPGYAMLDADARKTAVLLGAREITWRQLAAMVHLRLLGEEMGDPETAPERRHHIFKEQA